MDPVHEQLLKLAQSYVDASDYEKAEKLLVAANELISTQQVADLLALCRTEIAKLRSEDDKDGNNENAAKIGRERRLEPCQDAHTSDRKEDDSKENREEGVITDNTKDQSPIDEEDMNVADTKKYLKKAQEAIDSKDFEKAEEFLQDAEKLDPQLDVQDMHNLVQDAIFKKKLIDSYISSARDWIASKNFEAAEDNLLRVVCMDPEIYITEMLHEVRTGLDIKRKVSIKLDIAKKFMEGRKFEAAEKIICEVKCDDTDVDVCGLWNTIQMALTMKTIVNAYKKFMNKTITKSAILINDEEILSLFNAQMIESALDSDDVLGHVKIILDFINSKYAGQHTDNTENVDGREENSRKPFDGKDGEELLLKTNTIGTQTEKNENSVPTDNVTVDSDKEEDQVYLKKAQNALYEGDLPKAEVLLQKAVCLKIPEGVAPFVVKIKAKEANEQNVDTTKGVNENKGTTEAEKDEHIATPPVTNVGMDENRVVDFSERDKCLAVAKEAVANKDFIKAQRFLKKAVVFDPQFDVIDMLSLVEDAISRERAIKNLIYFAQEAIAEKKYEKAKQNLDEVRTIDPNVNTIDMYHTINEGIVGQRKEKLVLEKARKALEDKEFSTAERLLHQVKKADPDVDISDMLHTVQTAVANQIAGEKAKLDAQKAIKDKDFETAEDILNHIKFTYPEVHIEDMWARVQAGLNTPRSTNEPLDHGHTSSENSIPTENMNKNSNYEEVIKCVERAQQAYTQRDFVKAERLIRKALRMSPPEQYQSLAKFLYKIEMEKEKATKDANVGHSEACGSQAPESKKDTAKKYDLVQAALDAGNVLTARQILKMRHPFGPFKSLHDMRNIGKSEKYKKLETAASSADGSSPGTSIGKKEKEIEVEKLVSQALHAMDSGAYYLAEILLQKANRVLSTDRATELLGQVSQIINEKNANPIMSAEKLKKREAEIVFQMAFDKFNEKNYESAQFLALISVSLDPRWRSKQLLKNIIDDRYLQQKLIKKSKMSQTHVFKADCYIEMAETFFEVGNMVRTEEFLNKSLDINKSVKAQQMLDKIRSARQ